jgi:hypothetical protein
MAAFFIILRLVGTSAQSPHRLEGGVFVKSRRWKSWLTASIALNVLLLAFLSHGTWVRDTRADVVETEELVPYMALMQHLSHKLGLSIQAKNSPLAAFYLEEIEENVALIQKKFPTYDKRAVGQLAGVMFVPAIAPLEKSIKASNWAMSNAGYTKLVESCNGCHAATEHAFVKITAPAANPFNQSFSPQ